MSQRALDWFSFFLADIQTGFGPFVAVYLAANAWTQGEIGLVLTAGGLVALAVMLRYRELRKVEDIFRTTKSTLDTRRLVGRGLAGLFRRAG